MRTTNHGEEEPVKHLCGSRGCGVGVRAARHGVLGQGSVVDGSFDQRHPTRELGGDALLTLYLPRQLSLQRCIRVEVSRFLGELSKPRAVMRS